MKVILISDVENLGDTGEVKNVKNGMARNYLFPKKLAIKATDANLMTWEKRIESAKLRRTEILENAKALAEKLGDIEVSIPAKAGEGGRLFGSVTAQNISDALAAAGFDISRKDINLDGTIKALGTYKIALNIHAELSPEIIVNVVSEQGPQET